MANLKNFSAEEVKQAISGKYELYYSTIRYGYYLPKYKSGIITEAYITQVLAGQVYCPKFSDIKLAPCPQPPDKDTLIKYANQIRTPNGKPLGIGSDDHTPDKDWLLALLSTHRPDLKIFKKDYVPPPRVVKIDAKPSISLPSDFLEGLPVSRKKTKAKRLTMISKGKLETKLERAKFLANKYGQDQVVLQQEIKEMKKKSKVRAAVASTADNLLGH